MKKVFLNKISSIVKNANLNREVEISQDIECKIGAILAVKIINANTKYNVLELESGRMCILNDGDVIPVALGNRFASRGMCGFAPESLFTGDQIDILNLGGVAGICKDYNHSIGKPVRGIVLGAITKNGKNLMLENIASINPATKLESKIPLITIIGTGMDSGKTTVGSLIVQMLASMGKKVGVAKLSGVGAMRDVYRMIDYGAVKGLSFVDAGIPSTCIEDKNLVIKVAKGVINELAKDALDVIFIEFGDGLYGKYCVEDLLQDVEIRSAISLSIMCASDIPGALKLWEDCNEIGIKPALLSGPVTDNLAGIEILKDRIKIEAFNALKGTSVNAVVEILNKIGL